MDATDRIQIRGLRLQAIVGIHPWERKIPQALVLDVDLASAIRAAARRGDLDKTVDYSAVAEDLIAFIQARQFELIETLAEECAQRILTDFGVSQVTFRVCKPEAVAAADTVCIEITRQRND